MTRERLFDTLCASVEGRMAMQVLFTLPAKAACVWFHQQVNVGVLLCH